MKFKTTLTILTYFALAAGVIAYVYPKTSLYITILALMLVEGFWTAIMLTIKDLSGLGFIINPGSVFVTVLVGGTIYAGLQGYGNTQATLFGVGAAFLTLPIGFLITKYWNM